MRLLPLVLGLSVLPALALAQGGPGGGPGPGPAPNPWAIIGNAVSYNLGGVLIGTPTGGTQGVGTINVSGGFYVNGVPTAAYTVSNPIKLTGSVIGFNYGFAGTFTAGQVVNLNATSAPAAISGSGLNIVAADAAVARIQLSSFGAISAFSGAVYGGTNASPTAVVSGTQLTGINAYAYNGASLVGPIVSLRGYAAENIASGHQGTKLCMATTAIAGTTLTDGLCQQNDGGVTVASPTGGSQGSGTLNATGLFVNGTAVSKVVASGTKALATSAITSGTCTAAQTATATGTLTTDVVEAGFNGDPTGVTGFAPLTTGSLVIYPYPTADTVNFKVCNLTSGTITPGAVTLNFRVGR